MKIPQNTHGVLIHYFLASRFYFQSLELIVEGWGLHNEFSSQIHWRFLHHFLFTCGCVSALGLCGEEFGGHAIGCVDPKRDHQENILGSSKCKAHGELSLTITLCIYSFFHGLLTTRNSPIIRDPWKQFKLNKMNAQCDVNAKIMQCHYF